MKCIFTNLLLWWYYDITLLCFRCCIKTGRNRKDCLCGSISGGHCFSNTLSRTVAHDKCVGRQCLGGLEDHPPCPHCLMGHCITVGKLTRIQGSCAPDITNHTKRHKNCGRFSKRLKDRGLWQLNFILIERPQLVLVR